MADMMDVKMLIRILEFVPYEMLAGMLKKDMEKYNYLMSIASSQNEKDEAFKECFVFIAMLITLKSNCSADDLIKSFDEFHNIMKLLKPNKQ
jgi:hypothetical protein